MLTFQVDRASDGNADDHVGESILVNEAVGAVKANTGRNFGQRREGLLGDVVDTASTVVMVLLRRLLLPNRFAVVFLFPACEGSAFLSGLLVATAL